MQSKTKDFRQTNFLFEYLNNEELDGMMRL